MTVLYCAPTEPPELKAKGISTLLPEEFGVDYMWECTMGRVGVQRKRFPDDFLASVHDGRLNREYAMMKELDLAVLLLEGKGMWTTDGQLIRPQNGKRWSWNLAQHRAYCASVQLHGVQVHTSSDIGDTGTFIDTLRMWSDKADHNSLFVRPGPRGSGGYWGDITNEDYQLHMHQGLPGVGPKLAKALLDELGFIFTLGVTREQLMSVKGMGKGKADKIMKVFNGSGE